MISLISIAIKGKTNPQLHKADPYLPGARDGEIDLKGT